MHYDTATRRSLELLEEDVPGLDLTTYWLGIGSRKARIRVSARGAGRASGIVCAARLSESQDMHVEFAHPDGSDFVAGQLLLSASGSAADAHRVWKSVANILEFSCAVATRTRALVDEVGKANPRCAVFSTRKLLPGTRPWAVQAVLDGGGFPHRLGTAETVMIFDQHKAFFTNRSELLDWIALHRHAVVEKKIFVEVSTLEEAQDFASIRVDGLQFDKIPHDELALWVKDLRDGGYVGTMIATGGISGANALTYAATGVDGIASSWMYAGPGLDMAFSIEAL